LDLNLTKKGEKSLIHLRKSKLDDYFLKRRLTSISTNKSLTIENLGLSNDENTQLSNLLEDVL
jgi:hypothetical protein